MIKVNDTIVTMIIMIKNNNNKSHKIFLIQMQIIIVYVNQNSTQ